MKESKTGLRRHSKKLYKEYSRLNIRKISFFNRVVDQWNKLLEFVVSALSVDSFKTAFNEHNQV